jgi:DNA repair exonuclease SbcCD ATPase subunit
MVFKHHNHLEPTMLAFDNKLKGFKKVFKSFDQNAEQSKAELKTMMESNKKFRERLAKKEAQLQEILSNFFCPKQPGNGPMGKHGMSEKMNMFNDYQALIEVDKSEHDLLKMNHDTKNSHFRRVKERREEISHKLEHFEKRKQQLLKKITKKKKEIDQKRGVFNTNNEKYKQCINKHRNNEQTIVELADSRKKHLFDIENKRREVEEYEFRRQNAAVDDCVT